MHARDNGYRLIFTNPVHFSRARCGTHMPMRCTPRESCCLGTNRGHDVETPLATTTRGIFQACGGGACSTSVPSIVEAIVNNGVAVLRHVKRSPIVARIGSARAEGRSGRGRGRTVGVTGHEGSGGHTKNHERRQSKPLVRILGGLVSIKHGDNFFGLVRHGEFETRRNETNGLIDFSFVVSRRFLV